MPAALMVPVGRPRSPAPRPEGREDASQEEALGSGASGARPLGTCDMAFHCSCLLQGPNSFFMDVRCPGCFNITTVFSHATTVVVCGRLESAGWRRALYCTANALCALLSQLCVDALPAYWRQGQADGGLLFQEEDRVDQLRCVLYDGVDAICQSRRSLVGDAQSLSAMAS